MDLDAIGQRALDGAGPTIKWEDIDTVAYVCAVDVPNLIAEVRRLREENERLLSKLNAFRRYREWMEGLPEGTFGETP